MLASLSAARHGITQVICRGIRRRRMDYPRYHSRDLSVDRRFWERRPGSFGYFWSRDRTRQLNQLESGAGLSESSFQPRAEESGAGLSDRRFMPKRESGAF